MKVYTTPITKEQLSAIPARERTFLVGIGHIANEISVLQKVFYWSSSSSGDHDLIKKAHTTQAITIAKVLAGKLSEAWRFLEKAFFASSLSKDWESRLQADASVALDSLKKYFGRTNSIVSVRNAYAFHYSVDDIARGFDIPPDQESWLIVMSESRANSLYYIADLIANYAMLEDIRPGNHQAAIETLITDITNVARWLVDFAGGAWIVGSDMYLSQGDRKMLVQEYIIDGAPAIDDIELPFFLETPNKPLHSTAHRYAVRRG